MRSSEERRVAMLSGIFAQRAGGEPGVLVGIGDDAAVLAACAEPLVWTVDAAVEGVHFRRDWASFEEIGYRSTMAAASDLAAMAAAPLGLLSGLVLPDDVDDEALEAIARGQREAASEIGAAVVGGNLARGRELSITTTALGRAPRPVQRSGARPGDAVWLLGPVGLAAAGLRLLMRGSPSGVHIASEVESRCLAAWRRPRARIDDGLALRGLATAAVDVSDGLARDAGHLARASGVQVVLDLAAIEADPILRDAAALLGVPASELALHGGEDYALVYTSPVYTSPVYTSAAPSPPVYTSPVYTSSEISGGASPPCGGPAPRNAPGIASPASAAPPAAAPPAAAPSARRIGSVEPAAPGAPPVVLLHPDGAREPLTAPAGFDHFTR